ncbi:hypothetical protein KP509_1Z104700 [Ceratopteris richardii]|nr:hypothetical protein KP509_1Z104700 [Ceratopteris richardii]
MQALLLWWKGVSFLQHPKYVNGNAYREDAIQKDIELSSSKLGNDLNLMGCCALKSTSSKCTRSYTWYEAQWPWT